MYNGFKNYQTWALAVYLQNTECTYRYWMSLADELDEIDLADAIRESVEKGIPEEVNGFHRDVLTASLEQIDFYHIARIFKED